MSTHDKPALLNKIVDLANSVGMYCPDGLPSNWDNDDFIASPDQLLALYDRGKQEQNEQTDCLKEALITVTSALTAAHSLLQRGGKKAAASDTIFSMMLSDYEKAIEVGRKALNNQSVATNDEC